MYNGTLENWNKLKWPHLYTSQQRTLEVTQILVHISNLSSQLDYVSVSVLLFINSTRIGVLFGTFADGCVSRMVQFQRKACEIVPNKAFESWVRSACVFFH